MTQPTERPADSDRPTPEEMKRAMATYSADGQVDDATGGNAAAETLLAQQDDDASERIGPV